MDNGQHANISGGDLSLITSLDQNEPVRSHHEIMMRRLKNRERQRRYRARKRLAAERQMTYTPQPLQYVEADTQKGHTSLPLPKEIKRRKRRKKVSAIHQFTPAQIEIPLNVTLDFATRVHSRRDWKRDARRAHTFKQHDIRANDPVIPVVTSVSGSQVQTFASGVYPTTLEKWCHPSGTILDFSESQRVVPSRRHWKEEARNKKS
ncbi:hypothetical protein ACH5RR_038988 [Cinchona calisaya]|uniref:BZIP domain-containing protein n=1 Tax=Cinchona calisaya TaxID=153742 RepID=A0ABD2XZV7_9GENT